MRKAIATYIAPPGDNKVCEMAGVTFFDGQPVDLNSYDHPDLMTVLESNQHFDFEVGEEVPDEAKPKRGRPPKEKLSPEQQQKAQVEQTVT